MSYSSGDDKEVVKEQQLVNSFQEVEQGKAILGDEKTNNPPNKKKSK